MQRISKPHLVDLLRFFDKKRIFSPRIRYASVRSKPELIKDLKKYFFTYERGDVLNLKVGWSAGNPFYYGYGFDIVISRIIDGEVIPERKAIEQ